MSKASRSHPPSARKPALVSGDARPSPRWRFWAGLAALVTATVLCYLPALRAGFVWDDDVLLTNNAFVKLPSGLFYIWASTALPDYFPLTSTSFWLEWRLWGENLLGYHLTNVLLHAASAVLLWRVLLLLRLPGAWLAALVFAIHPVNVQSVAWIAERKNTLCMVFFLVSIFAYLRFDQDRQAAANRKWYGLSLGAFLCALLSKTAVVMLPVILVLYHWWQRMRGGAEPSQVNSSLRAPSAPASVSVVRGWVLPDLPRLLPFFALSLVLGLVTVWFQAHRAIGGDPIRSADFLTRLAGAGRAVWFYLGKLLIPTNLSFIYPHWEIDPRSIFAWLPLAGLALVVGVCWAFRRRWGRHALLALGWFVLLLLPVLGFVDIYFHRYAPVADHWSYFGGIGIIVLVVGTGAHLFSRYRSEETVWLLPVTAVLAVGWMSVATWRQAGVYQNPATLWTDTLAKNPACWLAHNGLGTLHANAGNIAEARFHFAKALALKPDAVETLNNFASVLLDQGRPEEAIVYLQKALEVAPQSAMAHYNLGNAQDALGQPETAEKYYRRALELDPGHAESHSNLGCLLYAAGRRQEAIEEFIQAITLKPAYAEALNNLGAIFLEQGNTAQAESLLWDAVRSKPAYSDAWFNLGNALLRQGRVQEAALAYRRVLALVPRHALARCRLGTALWHGGDARAALEELASALQLEPDLAEAHRQVGIILAAQGQSEEALAYLRRAVELRPEWPEALASLAFTLASAGNEPEQNGAEALQHAQRAVELTGRTNFVVLDALAAALAETASFDTAMRTARRAAELARAAGDTNQATQIEMRIKQYEAGQPHRQ